MKFSHLAPTDWIPSTAHYSECFLTLAHLVEKDENYVLYHQAAYQDAAIQGREIVKILDNGAFEFYKEHGPGYVFDPHKLIDLGKRIGADYIVLPDYPAQEADVTISAAHKFAPMFKSHGFGTFFAPQSEIGNYDDYIDSIAWAATSPLIDYIGISILGCPNAFGVEKGNKLQRYNSRAWLMSLLYQRGILDTIRMQGKKIHFLGMVDGPNEVALIKYSRYIDSWDSSAAIWAALNGIRFDSSPTGLIDGKFELPVDFKYPFTDGKIFAADIHHNCTHINNIISSI